jgi:hypothetical protein
MYRKRLNEEGFEIQFIIFDKGKDRAVLLKDFYGAVNYTRDENTSTVAILPQQQEVAVMYKNEESPASYVAENPEASPKFQLSVLSFSQGETLDIEQNGFYFDQNDITITNYWAWEKVGDMLPYDFKEKVTGIVKTDILETVTYPNLPMVKPTGSVKQEEKILTDNREPLSAQRNISGDQLTGINWKMEESRVIDGSHIFYYKRNGEENTINFDNDLYTFHADHTGTYFYNGQEYTFNWKYLDTERTKMEMVILYPTPLMVTLENITHVCKKSTE